MFCVMLWFGPIGRRTVHTCFRRSILLLLVSRHSRYHGHPKDAYALQIVQSASCEHFEPVHHYFSMDQTQISKQQFGHEHGVGVRTSALGPTENLCFPELGAGDEIRMVELAHVFDEVGCSSPLTQCFAATHVGDPYMYIVDVVVVVVVLVVDDVVVVVVAVVAVVVVVVVVVWLSGCLYVMSK